MSKSLIIKLAKKYIANIVGAGVPVQEAYVFGSSVKGQMRKGSDIDICIISPIFGKDRINERLQLMKLQEGVSSLIEPHPYSITDFNNRYDALSHEIKKYGIKIH